MSVGGWMEVIQEMSCVTKEPRWKETEVRTGEADSPLCGTMIVTNIRNAKQKYKCKKRRFRQHIFNIAGVIKQVPSNKHLQKTLLEESIRVYFSFFFYLLSYSFSRMNLFSEYVVKTEALKHLKTRLDNINF